MRTRIIATFLLTTMVIGLTGCNVNININDTPQLEKNLYDAPQRNSNIMVAKEDKEISDETSEMITDEAILSTNKVENLQIADLDSHDYAGASYKLKNGYLAVVFDKDKLWKLEVYGYEVDGGLPYEKVELANLVENEDVVRFDLVATTNYDTKEYYTYKYDIAKEDRVFRQIDLTDYEKATVFDRIDDLKYGLFVRG